MLKLTVVPILFFNFMPPLLSAPRIDFFATGVNTMKVIKNSSDYEITFTYLVPCGVTERGLLLTPVNDQKFKLGVVLEGSSVQCGAAPSLKTQRVRFFKNNATALTFVSHSPDREKQVKLGYMEILYQANSNISAHNNLQGIYYQDCTDRRPGGYFIDPRSGEIAPLFISAPIDDNATSCQRKRHLVNLPPSLLDTTNLTTIPYKPANLGNGNRFSFRSDVVLAKITQAKMTASTNKNFLKLRLSYTRAACRQLFLGALIKPANDHITGALRGGRKNRVSIGVVLIADSSSQKASCSDQVFTRTIFIPKIAIVRGKDIDIDLINKPETKKLALVSPPVRHNAKNGETAVLYNAERHAANKLLGVLITPHDPTSHKQFTALIYREARHPSDLTPRPQPKGMNSSRQRMKKMHAHDTYDEQVAIKFKTSTSKSKASPLYPLQLTSY